MKDVMTTYLKEVNENATPEEAVTRLYYTNINGEEEYVEDFSFYMNERYASKELLDAVQNKQTLTTKLQNELNQFIIEKRICSE